MSVAALNVNLAFACKLDETSGSSILDWKGSKIGTLTGGVLNQAGPSAAHKSIEFNGSSDFIEFTDAILAGAVNWGAGEGSIEIWVKLTAGGTQFIIQKSVTSVDARFQITFLGVGTPPTPVQYSIIDAALNQAFHNDPTDHFDSLWHQYVLVRDNTANLLRADFDGVGTNSTAGFGSIDNTGSLFLAKRPGFGGSFMKGNLALPRIWTGRALSAADVTELYAAGAGFELNPAGPTAAQKAAVVMSMMGNGGGS